MTAYNAMQYRMTANVHCRRTTQATICMYGLLLSTRAPTLRSLSYLQQVPLLQLQSVHSRRIARAAISNNNINNRKVEHHPDRFSRWSHSGDP